MINPSIPTAVTHDQRAFVWSSLDPNGRLASLKFRAENGAVEWLQSALDIGMFSFSDKHFELESIDALFSFLGSSIIETVDIDPVYGKLAHPVEMMSCRRAPEFKEFFDRFVHHLLDEMDRFNAEHPGAQDPDGGGEEYNDFFWVVEGYRGALAKSIVGAAALDMPHLVEIIVDRRPEVAGFALPSTLLGHALSDFVERYEERTFTPVCFAMQFSNIACLDAIWRFSPNAMDLVKEPSTHAGPRYLDVAQGLGKAYVPACLPSTFAHVLKARLACQDRGPVDAEALVADALNTMTSPSHYSYKAHFRAFQDAGVFAYDAAAFAHAACVGGHAEVIDMLPTIAWRQLDFSTTASPVYEALLKALNTDVPERFGHAIQNLYQRAARDGREDLVRTVFEVAPATGSKAVVGKPTMEPTHLLIRNGFVEPLLTTLECGVDPTGPSASGGLSPIELADLYPGESQGAAEMIRSFAARKACAGLLAVSTPRPIPSP